jgi:hypothetical protein
LIWCDYIQQNNWATELGYLGKLDCNCCGSNTKMNPWGPGSGFGRTMVAIG